MPKNGIDILKASKPARPTDIIFIAAVVIASAAALFIIYSRPANFVEINYAVKREVYPLNSDRRIKVLDALTVVIENGSCYVEAADCPDKVCVDTGRISLAGQVIVCAPLGVIIRIAVTDAGGMILSGGRALWKG